MKGNKLRKRLLSIVSALFVVLGIFSVEGWGVKQIYAATSINEAKVGDIITFGRYEQDNNRTNGKEPIDLKPL